MSILIVIGGDVPASRYTGTGTQIQTLSPNNVSSVSSSSAILRQNVTSQSAMNSSSMHAKVTRTFSIIPKEQMEGSNAGR